MIASKSLGETDSDRKPAPLFTDESTQKDELTSGGYGAPTTGKYDASIKGYKTFGTEGQGSETLGAKDKNTSECKERYQMITVTATKDTTASDTVLLEVGTFGFDLSGAKALATSALVLLAISQF